MMKNSIRALNQYARTNADIAAHEAALDDFSARLAVESNGGAALELRQRISAEEDTLAKLQHTLAILKAQHPNLSWNQPQEE